jgi:hypothetical protein
MLLLLFLTSCQSGFNIKIDHPQSVIPYLVNHLSTLRYCAVLYKPIRCIRKMVQVNVDVNHCAKSLGALDYLLIVTNEYKLAAIEHGFVYNSFCIISLFMASSFKNGCDDIKDISNFRQWRRLPWSPS